jgi:hypothetical protein
MEITLQIPYHKTSENPEPNASWSTCRPSENWACNRSTRTADCTYYLLCSDLHAVHGGWVTELRSWRCGGNYADQSKRCSNLTKQVQSEKCTVLNREAKHSNGTEHCGPIMAPMTSYRLVGWFSAFTSYPGKQKTG